MKILASANIKKGMKVLVRYDLDVPIENGIISETYRLDSNLPTLKYITEREAFPIIIGHIGQPKNGYEDSLSTKQLAPYFMEKLGAGNFELLENLRFDPREIANDLEFAQELARKADIYVNECFSTSHRKHASFIGIPKYLPSYAGLRLEKEVSTLSGLTQNPQRPFVVLIGGAKLESKMPVVSKFLEIADKVLLGGKLGLEWSGDVPEKLFIPSDYAKDNKDIGPNTIMSFNEIISGAKTVLWAGPMGMYEVPEFSLGTREIAQNIVKMTKESGLFSVIGGGDTITAVRNYTNIEDFSFVSTGGGAMLTYLAEGTLPGIEALE